MQWEQAPNSSLTLWTLALLETRLSFKLTKYPTFLWLIRVRSQNTAAINQQSSDYFLLMIYVTHKQNLHLEIYTYSPHRRLFGKITFPTNLIPINPTKFHVLLCQLLLLSKHPTVLTFTYSGRNSSSALQCGFRISSPRFSHFCD